MQSIPMIHCVSIIFRIIYIRRVIWVGYKREKENHPRYTLFVSVRFRSVQKSLLKLIPSAERKAGHIYRNLRRHAYVRRFRAAERVIVNGNAVLCLHMNILITNYALSVCVQLFREADFSEIFIGNSILNAHRACLIKFHKIFRS